MVGRRPLRTVLQGLRNSLVPNEPTAPLGQVAIPLLSRLHDDPERYRRVYIRVVQKIALVAVPLVTFLVITSDWVIDVIFCVNFPSR